MLDPGGLDRDWVGIDRDGNGHHWAAMFMLGHYVGGDWGQRGNYLWEWWSRGPDRIQPEDIKLGDAAALVGDCMNQSYRPNVYTCMLAHLPIDSPYQVPVRAGRALD